jgi:hypothetical protein
VIKTGFRRSPYRKAVARNELDWLLRRAYLLAIGYIRVGHKSRKGLFLFIGFLFIVLSGVHGVAWLRRAWDRIEN